ncbi:hypothetical protein H0H92_010639 [Tricholoma furcatifolium]|nr:hypothetical protein H0H92_010639 [Tricholoma furcatifolium]
MALGCAFIFLVIIWCCRRRARKQRAKKTTMFAAEPAYVRTKSGWRWRLIRFGEKLFGHKRSRKADLVIRHQVPQDTEAFRLEKIRAAEEARSEEDLVQLIGDYNYPDSPVATRHEQQYHTHNDRLAPGDRRSFDAASRVSAPSIYSQMTGMPHRTPDPRQPLKQKNLVSRFSSSTFSTSDEGRNKSKNSNPSNPFWQWK